MSAAAFLLDPYLPLETSASGYSRSTRDTGPLIRQDTPQLAFRDYQRWQYSPVLPVSPELDYRRVRRKPSIQNLTGRSAHSAFSWTPSSNTPPSFHSFGPRDLQAQLPHTPRPRAYTASPSLSSTITTLQSTPTHTPIFRGGSFDEQRRRTERCELEEPIGTKRKYPSVKHARRFPRRQENRAGSEDSGVYKVYAAVFDISGEQGGLKKEADKAAEQHASTNSKRNRAVRFTGVNPPRDESVSSTPDSGLSHHRQEQATASTYSLSKFEFPAPPNRDNWAGASDRLPTSPSATVLYRGASFDLINPHASLLLGNNSIETPAEIDGLLDDYFEDRDDFEATDELVVMASNRGTGEQSQQSFRSTSENSKQTHTLYDDADTARRQILRIPTPVTIPPQVEVPAASMPNFTREQASDSRPSFSPLKRTNTNPFRNKLSSLGRRLGVNAGDSNQDAAEEGRAPGRAITHKRETTAGKYDAQRHGITKNEDELSPDGESHLSDPFDLSMSEARNNAELMSINGVLRAERSVTQASTRHPTDRRNALTVEDDSNTHAMSETERELGSIINRYDYTREITVNDPSTSSPSVERGLRDSSDYTKAEKYGWATPLSPGAQIRKSYHGFRVIDDPDEDPEPMQPKPLVSRRQGFQHHRNMPSVHRSMRLSGSSDVPTSEQTYGETNQLLLITPTADAQDPVGKPVNCPPPIHVHRDASTPLSTPKHYAHDDKENTPPGHDDHALVGLFDDDDDLDFPPQMRTGSVVMSPSFVVADRHSRPSQYRTSSIYPESGWETQRSESPGLTETEDEDENGERYMTSSPSLNSIRAHDDRKHLATTSFPNLDNPSLEISPQRSREKGRGLQHGFDDQMSPDIPPVPSSCFNDGQDEILNYASDPRHHNYLAKDCGVRFVTATPDQADFDISKIDFGAKPTGDAKRAMKIIDGKASGDNLGVHRLCSPGDRSERRHAELKELENIRSRNPAAVREASARVARSSTPNLAQLSSSTPCKLQKVRNPFVRPDYKPSRSFQKAAAIGRHDIAHGSFSSQRSLLSPRTPSSSGLEFSESEGTFVTVRGKKQSIMSGERGWDPYNSSPTDQALARIRSPPSDRHTCKVPTKMRHASNQSRNLERSAINGQVELQTFKLKAKPSRNGLTERELQNREPMWSQFPQEGTPQRRDAELLPYRTHKEQSIISDKYRILAAIIPFGGLLYGLGGFDWIITRKTQGRITTMGQTQKRHALLLMFPLQLLGFTIVALVAGILVYISNRKG